MLARKAFAHPTDDVALLATAGLATALEALGRPGLLVDTQGRPVQANTAARALLDADRARVETELREATRNGHPAWRAQPVYVGGVARGFLVTSTKDETSTARAALAAKRWGLSRRQTQVLALIVEGASNRAIAAELGIAERTVEVHVTACFDRAGVDSRSALVARVYAPR